MSRPRSRIKVVLRKQGAPPLDYPLDERCQIQRCGSISISPCKMREASSISLSISAMRPLCCSMEWIERIIGSGSGFLRAWRTSSWAKPLIEVSGARSSWAANEMNTSRAFASSAAIAASALFYLGSQGLKFQRQQDLCCYQADHDWSEVLGTIAECIWLNSQGAGHGRAVVAAENDQHPWKMQERHRRSHPGDLGGESLGEVRQRLLVQRFGQLQSTGFTTPLDSGDLDETDRLCAILHWRLREESQDSSFRQSRGHRLERAEAGTLSPGSGHLS